MSLTIYILSRNLPDNLGRMLDSLLPWQSDETQVIVGDNSDGAQVVELIEQRKADFNGYLRCIKHSCNIGVEANKLRAFEIAESRYLWIVGCGDRFLPGAVDTVESLLSVRNEAVIVMPVNGLKSGSWPQAGIYSDFAEAVEQLGIGVITSVNCLFYNVACARTYLPVAYEAASSLIPQTAIIAAAMKDGNKLYFHPQQVFERLPRSRSWDPRQLWINLSLIYPRLQDRSHWNAVRLTIFKSFSRWMMRIEGSLIVSTMVFATVTQFGWRSLPLSFRMAGRIFLRKLKGSAPNCNR